MGSFSTNYPAVILDEICLEGLDGITLQALWMRLSERFDIEVPNTLKKRYWNIVVNLKDVMFYTLPEPREDLVSFQRFESANGNYVLKPLVKDDPQLAIYSNEAVKDGYGSCKFIDARTDVTSIARNTLLEDADEQWGNRLVIVGTLEARWKALAPCSPPVFDNITKTQFSLLERIGRTRYNGETSVGGSGAGDPKSLFPHRKILLKLKLITKRPFTHRDDKNNVTCRLLHLPRFYRPYLSSIEKITEAIIEILKTRHLQAAPCQEMKEYVVNYDSKMVAKNVLKLQEFTKLVRTVTLNYQDMFPNAKKEDCIHPLTGGPKQIRAYQLIEQDETMDDQDIDDWEVQGSGFIRENLLRQVYHCIQQAGSAGLTQREVAESLGLDGLTARQALKHLDKRCRIHKSMIDIKRQRMTKFTCPEFVGQNACELVVNNQRTWEVISPVPPVKIDEPSTSKISDVSTDDAVGESQAETSNIDVSHVIGHLKKKFRSTYMTPTKILRTNFILEELRQRHIIYDIGNILRMCNNQERLTGSQNGLIDKKTIVRILQRLEASGQLRLIHIKLGKASSPKLTFVCEPHIDANHSYIQSVVEQVKMVYLARTPKKTPPEFKSKAHILKLSEVKKLYGFVPKFSKMRSFHEFLYHITYEHQNKKGELKDLATEIHRNECVEAELSTAYENAPEKYLFVPPAPEHAGWPKGWLFLADILLCIPLHLFLKLVRVTVFTPKLVEYVKHPLKSQLLVKNLPIDIQNILFYKRRHIFSMYEVVQRLCLFGLARFGPRIMKDKDRIFVYLNKQTSLLDTTVSSPSYMTVEDKEYVREHFKFENAADVANYWNRLQIICLNTQLGFSKSLIGMQVEIHSAEAKLASELKSFSMEEVEEMDNGLMPGDARGAAGLDSSLYTHIRRSWLTLLPMKPIKRKLAEKSGSQMSSVARKKPKLGRTDIINAANAQLKKKGKHFVRTISERKNSKIRKPLYDEIDRMALKNLSSLRSTWHPKEDRVLLLAKTATGIMFSNPRLAPSSVIRDMLHVATKIVDKTSASCRRRLLYMAKHPYISHNIHLCLAEAKQNPYIQKIYSNYYHRNRVVESSPQFPQFVRECRIHFIELVQFLHRYMYGKSDAKINTRNLPQNLFDLHQKFNIEVSSHNVPSFSNEPDSIVAINQNALTCVIHSALSSKTAKKSQSFRLLQIYRQFPETLLRETIVKVKASGMFAMTKKYLENDRISSYTTSFHLSQAYLYQLCTATPYTIFSEVFQQLNSMIQNNMQIFRLEMLDSGTTAILCDLNSANVVELDLIFPKNILIIDPKKSDKEEVPSTSNADEDKAHPSRMSLSSLNFVEMPVQHAQEALVVSSCDLNVTVKQNLDEFKLSREKIQQLLTSLTNDSLYRYESKNDSFDFDKLDDCDVYIAHQVFNYTYDCGPLGAKASDIRNQFTFDMFELEKVLVSLSKRNVFFRVGICSSRWVTKKHFRDWFVEIDVLSSKSDLLTGTLNSTVNLKRKFDCEEEEEETPHLPKTMKSEKNTTIEQRKRRIKTKDTLVHNERENDFDAFDKKQMDGKMFLCPTPWISPDGELNLRILWRWAGALLCYLISHPLIKLTLIQKRFTYLTPFHVRILIEKLTSIECTNMFVITPKKTSLWDDPPCTSIVKDKVCILHDDDEVLVEILENAILKLSLFKCLSMNPGKQNE